MAYTEKVNNIRQAQPYLTKTFFEEGGSDVYPTIYEHLEGCLSEAGFKDYGSSRHAWFCEKDECLMVWLIGVEEKTHIGLRVACRGKGKDIEIKLDQPIQDGLNLLLNTIRSVYFKTSSIDYEQTIQLYCFDRVNRGMRSELKDSIEIEAKTAIAKQDRKTQDELNNLFGENEIENKLRYLQEKTPTLTRQSEWKRDADGDVTRNVCDKTLSPLGKEIFEDCKFDDLLLRNFVLSVLLECGAKKIPCTTGGLHPHPTFLFEKDGNTLYVRFYPVCINVSLDEDPFGEGHSEYDFPKDGFTTLNCIHHTWEVEYGENTSPFSNYKYRHPLI